jgi:pilus assembly protein Flp/PilA
MKNLKNRVLNLAIWKDTQGQDLVEYALAAGLVAVVAVAAVPALGTTITGIFTKIGSMIDTKMP